MDLALSQERQRSNGTNDMLAKSEETQEKPVVAIALGGTVLGSDFGLPGFAASEQKEVPIVQLNDKHELYGYPED